MRRGGESGASEFLEELPALLVVLLGITVFLASSVQAYFSYRDYQDGLRLHQHAVDFSEGVRNYSPLLWAEEPASFSAGALNESVRAQFHKDFLPERLGFRYSVRVETLKADPTDSLWWAGEDLPPSTDRAGISSPVTVRSLTGQAHLGLLVVVVWGSG